MIPTAGDIERLVHRYSSKRSSRRTTTQLAFYGGNFLGLPEAKRVHLLEIAGKYVESDTIDGIRFSTRPDTITRERLASIDRYPVQTIELGVQSMDNHVLSLSRRGHCAEDTENAVSLLKTGNHAIGLQMMVGLPGEDESSCLSSGRMIADLLPDFVRIYPTVVLKGSLLARWHQQDKYEPLPLQAAVNRVTKLYKIFIEKEISVVRMGLQSTGGLEGEDSIIAGPYHPSFGELVYSEVFYESASALIHALAMTEKVVCLKVHPRSVSKLKGNKNNNINRLMSSHALRSIQIISDSSLSINEIDIVR